MKIILIGCMEGQMKQIREKLKLFLEKIIKELPEIILLLGLFFIILATFLINFIAGLYCLGLILTGLGVFLAKKPYKKNKKEV